MVFADFALNLFLGIISSVGGFALVTLPSQQQGTHVCEEHVTHLATKSDRK
jgi:hypothetical protein